MTRFFSYEEDIISITVFRDNDKEWYMYKADTYGPSGKIKITEDEAINLIKKYIPVDDWDDDLIGTELEEAYKCLQKH